MITSGEFLNSVPFILFFLILVLLIKITAGEKVVSGFLVLVFASMLLVKPDLLNDLAQKIKF